MMQLHRHCVHPYRHIRKKTLFHSQIHHYMNICYSLDFDFLHQIQKSYPHYFSLNFRHLKLMSIYRAAAEKNITIPQQLAVVGYSNETLSFILTPAPGGIDVPTQELGQQSCELLFQLIAGKPSPQNITVATHMSLK